MIIKKHKNFRKKYILNYIKTLVKIIKKIIFHRGNIPIASTNFDAILLATENKYNSKFLNRIENTHFKKTITTGTIIQYQKTKISNSLILQYEGEGKNAYRKDKNEIHVTPDVTLYSIQNGAIIGCEGYIYDTITKHFIQESLNFWFKWNKYIYNYYRSVDRFKSPTIIKGIILSICIPGGTGYFHFLLEALTKYLLFRTKFPTIVIDYIVVTGTEDINFIKMWLEFSGSAEKIIFTDFQSHYIGDQLLFLNTINYQYSPNQTNVSLLKHLIPHHLKNDTEPSKIILATRKGAKVRTIEWEDELAVTFDIEIVDFSTLSPTELITKCQDCKILIGAHGAALTNMVFCKPKTQVIEISFGINEVVYSRLASACDLNHIIFDIVQKNEIFSYLKLNLMKNSTLK